ncbi:MAG: alpha-amylase family glycosyl hydrolase [Elusimicrobiota bacterium]|jgi:hypothetical protein
MENDLRAEIPSVRPRPARRSLFPFTALLLQGFFVCGARAQTVSQAPVTASPAATPAGVAVSVQPAVGLNAPLSPVLPLALGTLPSLAPTVRTAPTPAAQAALVLPNAQVPTAQPAGAAVRTVPAAVAFVQVPGVPSSPSSVPPASAERSGAEEGVLPTLRSFGRRLSGTESVGKGGELRRFFDGRRSASGEADAAVAVAPYSPRRSLLSRFADALGFSGDGQDSRPADEYAKLKELKAVLGDGTAPKGRTIEPFGFRKPDGAVAKARGAGLEGFFYSKLENERSFGAGFSAGQVENYFNYLDALLSPAAWTAPLRRELADLRGAGLTPAETNRRLNEVLTRALKELRADLHLLDRAAWGRSAGIYMILARAYNRLKPGKNFFESIDDAEFARIRAETHGDVVWLLDIFEIGKIRRWGTGGGSPYALTGYRVKPELGGDAALRDFVRRAHAAGLKVMTDFIPNHTSIDSELVAQRPEATLHIVPPQDLSDQEIQAAIPSKPYGDRSPLFYLVETDNYPENGRRVHKKILVHHPRTDYADGMWVDMVQIDYSRPEARAWEIEQAHRLFEDFGIDAVRRDMAYYQANARFFPQWTEYLEAERNWPLAPWAKAEMDRLFTEFGARAKAIGATEFWQDFTDDVKSRTPAAFAIDEVYSFATDISRSGSDGIYNKADQDLSLGQNGLYDAMVSRDAERIRAALRNAVFRAWQKGGAAMVNFLGTHDGGEGNPFDKFGRVVRAAAATALMFRPVLIYNGVEQGVGQARNLLADLSKSVDREKSIPFDIPVSLNWKEYDAQNGGFVRAMLEQSARYRELFEKGAAEVLEPAGGTPIVAWTVGRYDEADGRQKAVLVAANFSEGQAWGRFRLRKPVLKAFGAFEPRGDRTYVLRDRVDLSADGTPKTYVRTGAELLREGLSVGLEGGRAHVLEIEEVSDDATLPAARQKAGAFAVLSQRAGAEDPAPAPKRFGKAFWLLLATLLPFGWVALGFFYAGRALALQLGWRAGS